MAAAPVGDNAMLDGVLQGENTTLGLGLIAYVGVLLAHAHHDTLRREAQHQISDCRSQIATMLNAEHSRAQAQRCFAQNERSTKI